MKLKKSWILYGVLAIIFIMGYSNYNSMVSLDENVSSQWGNVENVYQRRSDLIPNLVNTVKGYAAHEKEALTAVMSARAKATSINIDASKLDANAIAQFQQSQRGLTGALNKLMMVSERYPNLKANQNFMGLQAQLEGSENRIAVERRKFNQMAKEYNKKIKKLPGKFFNMFYGFEQKGYFKSDKGAEKAPKVSF